MLSRYQKLPFVTRIGKFELALGFELFRDRQYALGVSRSLLKLRRELKSVGLNCLSRKVRNSVKSCRVTVSVRHPALNEKPQW